MPVLFSAYDTYTHTRPFIRGYTLSAKEVRKPSILYVMAFMKLRFPKFSLLTLLFLVLALGAGMGLYWRWEPWVLMKVNLSQRFVQGLEYVAQSEDAKLKIEKDKEGQCFIIRDNLILGTLEPVPNMPKHLTVNRSHSMLWGRDDAVIYGWDLVTGKIRFRIVHENNVKLYKTGSAEPEILSSAEGIIMSLFGQDDILVLQNLLSGFRICSLLSDSIRLNIPTDERRWAHLAIAPDGSQALLCDISVKNLALVDLKTGKTVSTLPELPRENGLWNLPDSEVPPGYLVLEKHTLKGPTLYIIQIPSGHVVYQVEGKSGSTFNFSVSPDQCFFTARDILEKHTEIRNFETGELLSVLPEIQWAHFDQKNRNEATLLGLDHNFRPVTYQRRRPEYWWGIAWLPEFWVLLASVLGLSVQAFRKIRSKPA